MRIILPSYAKINLTLRVIKKRPDGYHNLVSTFMRIPSGDVLYISESNSGRDIVTANIPLQGENIVAKALRLAREDGFKIPPLKVEIHKSIPPGSGLGAGSGNAAAVLWCVGAERVAAIGEHIEPLKEVSPHGVIAIPDWETSTKEAYSELDAMGYGVDTMLARTEMRDIYHANAGRKVGLLPNDFLKVLIKKHPKYNELFRMFEQAGADAWGVSGSGSAAFAVLNKPTAFTWPGYIKHVMYF